mmetsp:Transcript_10274/g.11730  ORF Transcript_10274/g.11730 Transcript_10274/m.11730 type:complete len:96 (+) Transcript_10274:511-798(+)
MQHHSKSHLKSNLNLIVSKLSTHTILSNRIDEILKKSETKIPKQQFNNPCLTRWIPLVIKLNCIVEQFKGLQKNYLIHSTNSYQFFKVILQQLMT